MTTPRNTQARNQTEFKRNRTKLLADNPMCHWCGRNAATEADHVTPIAAGPVDNTMDNLVPACKPCNARRGQALKTQMQRAKTLTNIEPKEKTTESVLLPSQTKPPQDTFSIYHQVNKGIGGDQLELARIGHDRPRLETTTHSESENYVGNVADFAARVMGITLMPWQLHVLAGITAYDVDGRWLHRQAYLSVARQNGKSTLNAALVGWWLTTQGAARGEPQTVITVAHDLSLAQSFFGYLAPILETHFGAKPSWSYGRSKVTMPDGSVWYARAATPNAGHGFSCSLIVADEIWQISEAAIDDGLLPSQRAKKNPLLLMTSTAGTQESHVMLRWRDQGLRQIDSGEPGPLYFAEYSPPAIDPMTPEAWAYANPALGHTLELDVIAAEAQSPNRAAFLRASVNLWQATSQGWLEPGLFAALACDDPQPAGGVLAIESSLDDSRYTGVRAVQTGDKTHVALAFVANSMAELWRHVDQITKENPTLRLAVTPGLDIHVPPHLETRRVIVGYKELLKWTATVRAMIVENRIKHNGEQTLTQQVERAVLVKHQGAIAVSSTRSPGPIEACRCMIWAAALASKPQLVGKPSIGGAFR